MNQTQTKPIVLDMAFHQVFNNAMKCLKLAEKANSDRLGECIEFAFEVATNYIPGLTSMGFPTIHRYQRRRALEVAYSIWLQKEGYA